MRLITQQQLACRTRCPGRQQYARIGTACRAHSRNARGAPPAQQALKRPSLLAQANPQEVNVGTKSSGDGEALQFGHLLLAVLDANEYLSAGSKSAVAAAAQLVGREAAAGRVTVLVVQEQGTTSADPDKQLQNITWHLRDKGVEEFSVMQRATEQPASVLIGDVADEVAADLVVVSSEAMHSKLLDANQLAEFVACPILVLP